MKPTRLNALCGIVAALALSSCDPLGLTQSGEAPAAALPAAATPPAAVAPAPVAPTPAAPAPVAAPTPAAPAPMPVVAVPAPSAPATPAPAAAPAAPSGEMELIKPKFPTALFVGTPAPAGNIPNLEVAGTPVQEFQAPKGTVNVAKSKTVTSSDAAPIIGDLTLVTDGDADGSDGCFVELAPGKQWLQIDLAEAYTIHKVLFWHFHKNNVVYFDVVVQLSDDPEFKAGVTTIYNNDHDNSSGLGAGSDKAWVETNHGRLVDGKGTKARYVRFWSNGNTLSELNHYIEVEVYATK